MSEQKIIELKPHEVSSIASSNGWTYLNNQGYGAQYREKAVFAKIKEYTIEELLKSGFIEYPNSIQTTNLINPENKYNKGKTITSILESWRQEVANQPLIERTPILLIKKIDDKNLVTILYDVKEQQIKLIMTKETPEFINYLKI